MFDHCIVLQNPNSTDAHLAERRVSHIRKLCPGCEVTLADTAPGGRKGNERVFQDLKDKLGSKSLLCVAAGDGTVSMVIDSLLHNEKLTPDMRRTSVLPLWCGNANDLAHMLNGPASDAALRRALTAGRSVAIRPLLCMLHLPDGSEKAYTAACYVSFGASAYAARELERTMRGNSPMRRVAVSRLGQEFVAVFRAMLNAPTFSISDGDMNKVVYERIFLNGSRFAKIFGTPLRLTTHQFHRATVERKDIAAVLFHIVGLSTGSSRTHITGNHDSFTIHDAAWAQFDGEAVQLPAGTRVELSISDRPFFAISTKLRNEAKTA